MNSIIYFCATYLIFIASAYAIFHVVFTSETKHYVKHIGIILGSAMLAWIVSHFMKDLIGHPRPDLSLALLQPNDPYSFPSGHATFMFALAWSMYSFDKRAGIIIFVLATLTGIARVLAGVHYWYDIVGGFIVGAFVSAVILYFTKKIRS